MANSLRCQPPILCVIGYRSMIFTQFCFMQPQSKPNCPQKPTVSLTTRLFIRWTRHHDWYVFDELEQSDDGGVVVDADGDGRPFGGGVDARRLRRRRRRHQRGLHPLQVRPAADVEHAVLGARRYRVQRVDTQRRRRGDVRDERPRRQRRGGQQFLRLPRPAPQPQRPRQHLRRTWRMQHRLLRRRRQHKKIRGIFPVRTGFFSSVFFVPQDNLLGYETIFLRILSLEKSGFDWLHDMLIMHRSNSPNVAITVKKNGMYKSRYFE